jgi:hypothetical protein
MKPRIFIASSSEGLEKARLVKNELESIADCQIWNEGFFENNKSSFESLSEGSVLFDFAVLVATKDDKQIKRKVQEQIARDNIILEFGLYVGKLGRNRSFLLKEKGLDLPSDLYGITLPEFKIEINDRGKTLSEICENIKKNILEVSSTYELSFVPSTVLALGYFDNFIIEVCRELLKPKNRIVNGKKFNDFILHIVLPDELPNNFKDQVVNYLSEKGLGKMSIATETREYNFYLNFSEIDNISLNLYDLPTTLSALKKSIELAIPKGYLGEGKRENILKKKEMHNFKETLVALIKGNPITKKRVIIDVIDVNS